MSADELAIYQAYDKIEPFGVHRDDLRFAMVACVIANANKPKNRRPFKVSDFILKFGPSEPQYMRSEDIKTMFKALTGVK